MELRAQQIFERPSRLGGVALLVAQQRKIAWRERIADLAQAASRDVSAATRSDTTVSQPPLTTATQFALLVDNATVISRSAGSIPASAGISFVKDVNLDLPSAPNERTVTKAFLQEGEMILQRTLPPLLEAEP